MAPHKLPPRFNPNKKREQTRFQRDAENVLIGEKLKLLQRHKRLYQQMSTLRALIAARRVKLPDLFLRSLNSLKQQLRPSAAE